MIDITTIAPVKKGDTKMITSAVTLSFPYLSRKNTSGEFPSNKYEANFAFSKLNKPLYDMITDCMKAAIEQGNNDQNCWGKKGRPEGAQFIYCVRPDKYAKGEDDREDPNGLMLKATTKYPPALLDAGNKLVPAEEVDEVFYSGAIVRCQVEFFPWIRGGKGGISAQLTVVQKLADGKRLGGNRYDEDDFALAGVTSADVEVPEGAEVANDLPF